MISTPNDIYLDLQIRLGKDTRGGYVGPDRFNIGMKVILDRKINISVAVFEETKSVTSDLMALVKTLGTPQYPPLTFTPVLEGNNDLGGYADFPADYWYECRANHTDYLNAACTSISEYVSVEFVSQHRFDLKMNTELYNPVKNPTENRPIIVVQNNKFFIYPFKKQIAYSYIISPEKPFWDYDIVDGIPVFLPAGQPHINGSVMAQGSLSRTTNVQLPESCYDEYVEMLVKYFAKADENAWNVQTAEQVK
jgi:hypothetical protein